MSLHRYTWSDSRDQQEELPEKNQTDQSNNSQDASNSQRKMYIFLFNYHRHTPDLVAQVSFNRASSRGTIVHDEVKRQTRVRARDTRDL